MSFNFSINSFSRFEQLLFKKYDINNSIYYLLKCHNAKIISLLSSLLLSKLSFTFVFLSFRAHIAKDVGTKTKKECEEHYFKYYVYDPAPELPGMHDI